LEKGKVMPQPWEIYGAQNGNTPANPTVQPWEHYSAQKVSSSLDNGQDWASRTGSDIMKNLNEGADLLFTSDQRNPLSNALQIGGKAANAVSAPFVEAAISGYNSLPQNIRNPISEIAQKGINTIRAAYQSGIDNLANTAAGKSFGDYGMNSPNLQSNMQGVSDAAKGAASILSVIPISKAAKATSDVVSDASKGVEGLADQYAEKYPGQSSFIDEGIQPSTPKQPITAPVIKQAAQNAYRDAENLGGTLSPEFTNKAIGTIENAKLPPIAGKLLTSEDTAINNALGEYGALKDTPLTLNDYQRLDSSLGDKAAQAFVSGEANKGRIIAGVQDKIRNMLNNLNEQDIAGGKEGFDALTKNAIPLWSTQAKMADIGKIIDRANMMDNPSTAMRTGFRNLMLSNKFSTYPKNIQQLITKAANTGKVDDLLGIVGSRLNAIVGGSVCGAPGMALSYATSTAGRGLRNILKGNQADNIINTMVEGVRPNIESYNFIPPEQLTAPPTMQEIMKMPPAQARAYLNYFKSNNARVQP
jgi:hypothetical protein